MRHENFISARGRIRKEMEKDGKGEAGIENRGEGILSPFSLNHFLQRKVKQPPYKQTQFMTFK